MNLICRLPLAGGIALPPGVLLRGYRPRDWSSYIKLDLEAAIASGAAYKSGSGPFSIDEWTRGRLTSYFVRSPTGVVPRSWTIMVLEEKDGPIFAQVSWEDEGISSRTIIGTRIESIAVTSSYRRRGFGRMLMFFAARHAMAVGAQQLTLEVAEDNLPALSFYEALGFTRSK